VPIGDGSVTVTDQMMLPSYPAEPGVDPRLDSPEYNSTRLRSPKQPLVVLPQRLTEVTGPLFGSERLRRYDDDLTVNFGDAEAIGQRIIVTGQVLDTTGHPLAGTLVEIWQANAGGRYRHVVDDWPSPLDPGFGGCGRFVTDADGRYRFTTIRPGAYPWGNHPNAWRPAHIHFSLFGRSFTQRLITQMYFPDDPLFFQDPIFNSVRDERARRRMISAYDHSVTTDHWAIGYRWDIVLRGAVATPLEAPDAD
jgi:protocatechuate 3,4-dioxygenase beta subunit